jgi:hypothetical protein
MAEFLSWPIFRFRSTKSEPCIRTFLAYCLQVTLKQRLWLHAPGLTPMVVLEKLAEIKMIDV